MLEDTRTQPPPDATYVDQGHQLPPPEDRPHHSLVTRILVWVLILLAFGLLFWWILHRRAAQKAAGGRHAMAGKVTVTTVTARKGNIGVYLRSIGTVTPLHTDTITSQVTGMISAVYYRQGQIVHKGAPLIDIDSRPYRAQLLEAQGALERDENLLAQAKMDAERYRIAWSRNAIAKQVWQDQEKVVLQDEGTVNVDRGTVAYNQVQVAFCHLTAPINGRVGLRLVDPGNVVQANSTTPLVVITQLRPMTVVFTIPEDNIAEVVGQMKHGPLQVTALNRSNQAVLATGILQVLDNLVDTTTGTLKLRALFANKNEALFPNQFVNINLLVTTLKGVTLIPNDAIQQNGDTSYVFVIRNNVAHLVDVKQGVTDNGITAVTGVNPGDVIADSSFQKLQDGSQVAISKTPIPASASGTNAP